MESKANAIQHGGQHYKAEYQHWDFAADVGYGSGYFLAAATKYVVRYKNKNGRQDLEKAHHYTQKLVELIVEARITLPRRTRADREKAQDLASRMCDANQCAPVQRLIVSLLAAPRAINELETAMEYIEDLMAAESIQGEIVDAGLRLDKDDFHIEGWRGGETDCYQCKHCRAHIEVPHDSDPSKVHQCISDNDTGAPRFKGYVDQDAGAV